MDSSSYFRFDDDNKIKCIFSQSSLGMLHSINSFRDWMRRGRCIPSQRASIAGSVSISWHHYVIVHYVKTVLKVLERDTVSKYMKAHLWRTLQWRHKGRDSVSNHQPRDCLLNRLFRRRSKKTSKHPVIGLCAGNSPLTGEFPAQMASDAENASIWWPQHVRIPYTYMDDLERWVWLLLTG